MSIAKRLGELERRTRDLRFHPETAEEARRAVLDVLPSIVDVVEAAEDRIAAGYVRPFAELAQVELQQALAGLEKALDDG